MLKNPTVYIWYINLPYEGRTLMKKKIIVAGIICTAIVLFSITFVGITKLSFINEKTANARNLEKSIDIKDQGEIQTLMLNAIDHYRTVQGTFEYIAADYHLLVDYQVDVSENPRSYEKVQSIKETSDHYTDTVESEYELAIYDGENLINYNSGSSDYKTTDVTKGSELVTTKVQTSKVTQEERNYLKGTTIKDRVVVEEDGEKAFYFRVDPAYMGIAKTSLLPEDIAIGLLENKKNWEIIGKEEIAGVNTVVIKGKLEKYYADKWESESFKLNIDPGTGIMLVMETYDSSGKMKDLIRTHDIKIDEELDEKLFEVF